MEQNNAELYLNITYMYIFMKSILNLLHKSFKYILWFHSQIMEMDNNIENVQQKKIEMDEQSWAPTNNCWTLVEEYLNLTCIWETRYI